MRWRREVERELRAIGLTFPQWLVLDATAALVRETDDAPNQNAVAARVELDKMTVSQIMRTLAVERLVDRGPDLSGRAYRICVTKRGAQVWRAGRSRVEAASLRMRERPVGVGAPTTDRTEDGSSAGGG